MRLNGLSVESPSTPSVSPEYVGLIYHHRITRPLLQLTKLAAAPPFALVLHSTMIYNLRLSNNSKIQKNNPLVEISTAKRSNPI
jgi:hypothetical protein